MRYAKEGSIVNVQLPGKVEFKCVCECTLDFTEIEEKEVECACGRLYTAEPFLLEIRVDGPE